MNSLEDLNGHGLTNPEYNDLRDPSVTFTPSTTTNQALTVYQGQQHTLPVGINIADIINYPLADVSYIIDLSSIDGVCYVQWDSLPSGILLTQTGNIWKLTGIKSASDWEIIKSPKVIINETVITDVSYTATIEYLSTQYKTWNINIHTLLYDVLSDPNDFLFEDGLTQLVIGNPKIYDYRVTQSTWTVTITPDDVTVFSELYTNGTGGTSTINNTTKVITLTGTKEEVNSHLNSLYITSNSTNTNDLNLTYYAVNNTGLLTRTVTQKLICNTVRYLGFAGGTQYYSEDITFQLTGLPQITNYDSIAYNGNATKTLTSVIEKPLFLGQGINGDVTSNASKFGGYSMAFNPANEGHLYMPDLEYGNLGSGNFTVEFWFGPGSVSMTGTHGIINKRNWSTSAAGTWGILFNAVNMCITFYDLELVTSMSSPNNTIALNTWQHIAVVRNSGTITLYIDGVSKATMSNTTTFNTNGHYLRVGDWDGSSGNSLKNCFVDEMRISNIARYTSNFTSPTAAFTTDINTTLLCHFDVPNSIWDESGYLRVNSASKAVGAGSMLLNRSYMNISASDDWNWYQNNFTIEMFVYKNKTSEYYIPSEIGNMEANGQVNYWSFGIDSLNKGKFYWYDGTEKLLSGTSTLALNTWHHLALTFNKKTKMLTLYVNGISEASVKVTGTPQFSNTTYLTIGKYNYRYAYSNYDEIRISDVVRYTSNFTPPTTTFVADNNTHLLIHCDDTSGSIFTDASINVNGQNYTYTATSDTPSALRTATSSGIGGTFSYSNGVITIVGNRSQINNRLSTISLSPASDFTSNYTLTCAVVTPENNTANKQLAINCGTTHAEVSNMSIDRNFYDGIDNYIFSTNTPQITDLDETSPNYTITLSTSNGGFKVSGGTAVSPYTYTGTKSQVNALFSTIIYVPNANTSSTFTYTQVKNSVTQVSSSLGLTFVPVMYSFTPSSQPAVVTGTINEGGSFVLASSYEITSVNSASVAGAQFKIDISGFIGSSIAWASLDPSIAVTSGGTGIYILTGIDTVAKWNSAKNPTVYMNNSFYGSSTATMTISFPYAGGTITKTWQQQITVNDVYPLTAISSTSSYYSGSNTTFAAPTLVDAGNQNPTWTVSIIPSRTDNPITWVVGGSGGSYSTTGNAITFTGTATEINSRMGSMWIHGDPYYDYTYDITFNATNNLNSESATRTKSMYSNNTSVSSAVGGATTYVKANTQTTITNAPTVTSNVSGNCTYSVSVNPSSAGTAYLYRISNPFTWSTSLSLPSQYSSYTIQGLISFNRYISSNSTDYIFYIKIADLNSTYQTSRVVRYQSNATTYSYASGRSLTAIDTFGDYISNELVTDTHFSEIRYIGNSFNPVINGSVYAAATLMDLWAIAASTDGKIYFWISNNISSSPVENIANSIYTITFATNTYVRDLIPCYSTTYNNYTNILAVGNSGVVRRYISISSSTTNPSYTQDTTSVTGEIIPWVSSDIWGERFVTCVGGTVKIYVKNGVLYSVEQSITAPSIPNFGTVSGSCCMSANGDYISIGDYCIYRRSGTTWSFHMYINTVDYDASRNGVLRVIESYSDPAAKFKFYVNKSNSIYVYQNTIGYATSMTDTKANINAKIPSMVFKQATGMTSSCELLYTITDANGNKSYRNQTVNPV